ncbi:hypothetical protein MKW98_020312 [Papaver atlanticum]|uniref:Ribosomal RNA-processing protein 43 n=1 Tax=Papaver atlanticum TaxID=357466 RepID=A0AAD4TE94_9MAGN|nr:hypothetical protein MKW98_020312 [Papaver atlanticum]
MGVEDGNVDVAAVDIEVDAFRRLFPLQYYERHFKESIRPDARPLGTSRTTCVTLGDVSSADGSSFVKIGSTLYSPDEGCLAIEFHMPPVCSPLVRPGRHAEEAPVIDKQLSDVILSSGMIHLKELSLISGKAAWMDYLDVYCLDADGSLFDGALLSAVAAFSSCKLSHS